MSYFGSDLESEFSRILQEHEATAFRTGLALGVICNIAIVVAWKLDGWWQVAAAVGAFLIVANTIVIGIGLSK